MRLIIRENGQERVVESDSEVVSIGRETDNTIDIDSPTSSRHHCEIRRTGTGHEVVDLESRNGTLVNGERCGKKPLNPGDRIEIGTTVFYFETAPDEGARPTAPQGVAPAPRHRAQASGWERERENLYRVLEINQFLLSETDLRALLSRILDTVVDVTGAERGFLILCEGGDLKVKASRNIDGEDVKKPAEKISHSIALRVAADGVPVLSEDAEADDRFREFGTVRDLKLRSVLCVPFRVGERVTGVVYVDNRFERGVFTQDDLHYAELVADQAALAIERARLSEDKARTERDLVQERERRAELEVQVDPQARHRAALSALEALESQGEKDRRRVEAIRARLKHDYSEIVTASPKMFEIFTVLDKVIDSTVPVLIQGESGTGKELIARAIHFNGPRGKKPYVSENCAAIPATLLESEFFGYVRGAFTGAHKDKKGLFEVAHTGTLFLDEIGDMNPD
ncbi:MAG: sigma 54-interacting transcriptional regulator, partial [Planctomycetes bacterium]|nr:sigma 54-interacting transcriptional regulator [Planctomycetota bacterium]